MRFYKKPEPVEITDWEKSIPEIELEINIGHSGQIFIFIQPSIAFSDVLHKVETHIPPSYRHSVDEALIDFCESQSFQELSLQFIDNSIRLMGIPPLIHTRHVDDETLEIT